MKTTRRLEVAVLCCLAMPAGLRAQQVKPQTMHDFECYVQSAEARMAARKAFVLAESDSALNEQLVRGEKIQTITANGPNPHKATGGMIYDWIGAVFIPGAPMDRLVRMLQDYVHRAKYFPEIIASSRLMCRTGDDHFGAMSRMKEPAVIDTESDVVWERLDAHRWGCRSYSTKVQEVGKSHNYLLALNTYWRFSEAGKGVYVGAESITLSGEFGSVMRTLGSMMGINPEKSLRKTLASMRESVLKPGLDIAAPPAGVADCGPAYRPPACGTN